MARAGPVGRMAEAGASSRNGSRRGFGSIIQDQMDIDIQASAEVDAKGKKKEEVPLDPGRKRRAKTSSKESDDALVVSTTDRSGAATSKTSRKRQKTDTAADAASEPPVEQVAEQINPVVEETQKIVAHQEVEEKPPSRRPGGGSLAGQVFAISPPRLKEWVRVDTGDSVAEAGIKLVKDILSPVTSLAALKPVKSSAGLSFHDYMLGEASSGYNAHMRDYGQGLVSAKRRPDVLPFMKVPLKLEVTLNVGFLVCLDSFLFNFTLLPLRCMSDMISCVRAILEGRFGGAIPEDMNRMVLVVVCMIGLNHVDISYLYHYIRGQMSSYIKLYVIYNVLEVFDRLFCSLGQDVFDQLSISSQTGYGDKDRERAERDKDRDGRQLRGTWALSVFYVGLSMVYVIGHATVLMIQVVVLNVAINSNNNALITLLVANNFTEIKVRG
jgi:hypothetical protein